MLFFLNTRKCMDGFSSCGNSHSSHRLDSEHVDLPGCLALKVVDGHVHQLPKRRSVHQKLLLVLELHPLGLVHLEAQWLAPVAGEEILKLLAFLCAGVASAISSVSCAVSHCPSIASSLHHLTSLSPLKAPLRTPHHQLQPENAQHLKSQHRRFCHQGQAFSSVQQRDPLVELLVSPVVVEVAFECQGF